DIESGSTRLILLCPAWKRWGTAKTVKPGTTILHSELLKTRPGKSATVCACCRPTPRATGQGSGSSRRRIGRRRLSSCPGSTEEGGVMRPIEELLAET